jgi:hypothetical protein
MDARLAGQMLEPQKPSKIATLITFCDRWSSDFNVSLRHGTLWAKIFSRLPC